MQTARTRLLQIAPPPSTPAETGSYEMWSEVQQSVATSLPEDYKWLIDTYGSGDFCDLLVVLNPFASAQEINLIEQAKKSIVVYEENKQDYPEQCPFSSFPSPNGLLPVAQDTNGNDLFWITSGPPEDWSLVHYNWRGGCLFQRHAMSLLNFIVKWVDGELPNSFFGRGNSEKIVRRHPIFRASS